MGASRYTPEEDAWLVERYPLLGPRASLLAEHDACGRFPERTLKGLVARAHVLGLHVRAISAPEGRNRRVERKVLWSHEPEMTAWMLEHDHGQRTAALSEAFRGRFGFGLSQTQISSFRGSHGTQTKGARPKAGDWHRRPVGFERDTGRGYILVKVREHASVPGSKDNWEMKHVLAWERANGREVPEGYQVMAGDDDCRNADPGNLVLVRKDLVAVINSGCCGEYHDAETLRVVAAAAELKVKVVDVEMRPRRCELCGREFTPAYREGRNVRTCPECVARGHRWKGERTPKGEARCEVCGKKFTKTARTQVRCPGCIAADPKADARRQKGGKR